MKTILQLLSCIFFLCSPDVYAQIAITYPSSRAVFQRDNTNEATIYIGGYFNGSADAVEARFVKRINGTTENIPAEAGWTTITTSPVMNNFFGSVKVAGGWYQLEVRSKKNGVVTNSSHVDRVGVGEVFIVAGQSNATGSNELPAGPSATDDRVNSVNFQNYNPDGNIILPYQNVQLPYPVYTHLESDTKLAPFGNNAWCWGAFGDELVNSLNVPVMIFNTGWTATSSINWRETIDINYQSVNGFGYHFPTGLPFGHLRLALNYYASVLGVRAILWHQGESDNLESRSREDYRNNMRSVIQASRDLSGKPELAWVMARASRYTVDGVSRIWEPVIQAQNDLIGLNGNDPSVYMPHVFEGPATDDYWQPPYRHDEVHFSGDGFGFLAQFWENHISSTFLNQSKPYPASPPHHVLISGNQHSADFTLTAPSGFAGYRWTALNNFPGTLSTAHAYSAEEGTYLVETRDALNNVIFSPEVMIHLSSLPVHLTQFTGHAEEQYNKLIWETTSETAASHFELERSTDMRNFKAIGMVKAHGESNDLAYYFWEDRNINGGYYYYRLKMVDADNSFEYSPTIAVHNQNTTLLTVYPNPVINELNIRSAQPLGVLELFDLTGNRIFNTQTTQPETSMDVSRLPAGLYLLKVHGRMHKILKH